MKKKWISSVKYIIKFILIIIVYLALYVPVYHFTNNKSFSKISNLIYMILIIPYFIICYKRILSKKIKKETQNRYNEIDCLYLDKKNRYKGIYNYLYKYITSNSLDDKIFIREIIATTEENKTSVICLSALLSVFIIVKDKGAEVFSTIVTRLLSLFPINSSQQAIVNIDYGELWLSYIIILIWLVLKTMRILSQDSYIKKVIDDIEKDVKYNDENKA